MAKIPAIKNRIDTTTVWLDAAGTPVACLEKIKVLNQNLVEIADIIREALEDAVLMGCDEGYFRSVLHTLVDRADCDFTGRSDDD